MSMNTEIKHIAALVATAIWADGEYDAAEKIVVAEIAMRLNLMSTSLPQPLRQNLQLLSQ